MQTFATRFIPTPLNRIAFHLSLNSALAKRYDLLEGRYESIWQTYKSRWQTCSYLQFHLYPTPYLNDPRQWKKNRKSNSVSLLIHETELERKVICTLFYRRSWRGEATEATHSSVAIIGRSGVSVWLAGN